MFLKYNFVLGQKILPDVLSHIGIRPANMPLYVRCPICDKEFKQKTTLLQHGCIHIESRPYPCPECGKRFRQQSHLTQHLRIHTNEKPFGCLYCPRFFRQRTILNQVVRKVNLRIDQICQIYAEFFFFSTFAYTPERNHINVASVVKISVRRPFWISIQGHTRQWQN